MKQVSNSVEAVGKAKVVNDQLAAFDNEAKKAGGFQQAFGPLGDILDIGDGQRITQEQENKVSPGTRVVR
ncbi:MAG: hypothetical protein WCA39_02150 [Nitrososphaeraceae archaeon]